MALQALEVFHVIADASHLVAAHQPPTPDPPASRLSMVVVIAFVVLVAAIVAAYAAANAMVTLIHLVEALFNAFASVQRVAVVSAFVAAATLLAIVAT